MFPEDKVPLNTALPVELIVAAVPSTLFIKLKPLPLCPAVASHTPL